VLDIEDTAPSSPATSLTPIVQTEAPRALMQEKKEFVFTESPPKRTEKMEMRNGDGRRLIVSREISLDGDIHSCEHLIVEGQVQAKLHNCHVVEVAPGGIFRGTAEIESADIGGRYEGDLVVKNLLRLRSGAVLSGKIRYGELEVATGGQIIGDIQPIQKQQNALSSKSENNKTKAVVSPVSSANAPTNIAEAKSVQNSGQSLGQNSDHKSAQNTARQSVGSSAPPRSGAGLSRAIRDIDLT